MKKKVLSIFLSMALILSSFIIPSVSAAIADNGLVINKAKIQELSKKTLNDISKPISKTNEKLKDVSKEIVPGENEVQYKPTDAVRVFVQLKGKTTLEIAKEKNIGLSKIASLESQVKNAQQNIINKVKALGTIRHRYTNVLNGFSAVVKHKDIETIKNMPGVADVRIANIYSPDMTTAVNLTYANKAWEEYDIKGEGMVVAIVDTGIDYTHKDMRITDPSKAKLDSTKIASMGGPGKFYTDKVPYGYNFADMNSTVIDKTSSMHGMHVSGIVAANATDEDYADGSGIRGVAPEAQLLAMKVFSNDPNNAGAYNDDIAAAIDDSVKHGADVINMSLGSPAGYVNINDPEQLAIKNATDAGVVVVVSAGNSGYSTSGYYYPYVIDPDTSIIGSPGLFPDTIQVASYENTILTMPALSYYEGDILKNIAYTTAEFDPIDFLKDKYQLVDCGIGTAAEIEGKDLKGKIALIMRGTINFAAKAVNAQKAGAVGVIIYNNAAGYINMAPDSSVKIPRIFISNSDGLILKNLIASNVEVFFRGEKITLSNPFAGSVSDFSSYGPSPDLSFKPDVMAPGGNIWSTVNNNKYENMSGTSMAAPHTSGGVALLLQSIKTKYPNLSGRVLVEETKKILMNTATPVYDSVKDCVPFTRNQGAGLINIKNAIESVATIEDSNGNPSVALKEIGNTTEFTLKVKNNGTESITYNVNTNNPILTNYDYYGVLSLDISVPISGSAINYDKTTITIAPNSVEEIKVTLTIPEDTPKNIFAEGFIKLQPVSGTDAEIGIPYMGFYGNWDEPRVFDTPMWDEWSYYGYTSLLTYMDDDLFYIGDEFDTGDIYPEYLSFSPDGDGYKDNVTPIISPLRNARYFRIEIKDADGNILRTVAQDEYMRKVRGTAPYKYSLDWIWDGNIYNPATGEYELAPEGEYSIDVIGKIDFEGAEESFISIPVKIDFTVPEVAITDLVPDYENKTAALTFEGTDNVGIYTYFIFKDNMDSDPIYIGVDTTVEVPIDYSVNNYIVVAMDHAGNISGDVCTYDSSIVEITSNDWVQKDESTYVSKVRDLNLLVEILNPVVSRIEYSITDPSGISTDFEDITSEELTINSLKEGINKLTFNIYAETSAPAEPQGVIDQLPEEILLETKEITLIIDTTPPTIFDNNFADGEFNKKTVTLIGFLSEPVELLTIGGIECTVDEDLSFSLDYTFESEGSLKIPVYIKDLVGNETEYAYRVFVDYTAPSLNMIDPLGSSKVVSKDTESYTVKFTAEDNVFGYKVFVNGSQIAVVNSETWNGVGTFKEFSYNVPVNTGENKVVVKIVDLLGNETVNNFILYKDVTAPVITLESPVDGADVDGREVLVKGKVADDTIVSVTVNGKSTAVKEDGSFETTVSFDLFGEAVVTVAAVDESGNKASLLRRVNLKDNVVPSLTIAEPVDGSKLENTLKVTVKGNASDDTDLSVTVNDKVVSLDENGNFSIELSFDTYGEKTITVAAVDSSGNKTTKTVKVTFVEPPKLQVQVTARVGLRVRKGPGTSYEIIGLLPYGTTVTVLGEENGWYKINYNGQTGYISAAYTKVISQGSGNVETPIKTVTITASVGLRVRAGAGTSYAKVGLLPYGTKIDVYGEVNGWYKIKYNGTYGYISAAYTKVVSQESGNVETPIKTVTVAASVGLRVRAGAGTSYAKIGLLPYGTKVDVYSEVNGWYKIKYNGTYGYIYKAYTK